MDVGGANSYLPGDNRLIDSIVYELKSQGIFDNFRKECIADVDTKPAYQNLRQRVEGSVAGFLKNQRWKPDMNKNHVREMLRRNISESGFLETGVERIVDQVVNPKINSIFLPQVESVVYKFLGIEKPSALNKENDTFKSNLSNSNSISNLLPKDLEAVSPEHESFEDKKIQNVETNDKADDDESPPFEPIEESSFVMMEENSVDSRLSGISGLVSHESNHSPDISNVPSTTTTCDVSCQDSELSKQSSEENSTTTSIVTNDPNFKAENGENKIDITPKKVEEKKATEEIKSKNGDIPKKSDHKSRSSSSHKRGEEKSKDEDKKKSSEKHRSSSDKHKSRHDSKDKDKKSSRHDKSRDKSHDKNRDKSQNEKSHDKNRHHSSKDEIKKPKKDDKDHKSSRHSSKSSSKDDSKSKSSHHSKSKSSSDKKDDKHRKSSSSSNKKESKKDDHYDSKAKKTVRRSTDRDSSDGHSGGTQSSSSSVADSSNSQKSCSNLNTQNSTVNSGNSVGNSEQTDNLENDMSSKKVSSKNVDESTMSQLLQKYKEKPPKFASNFKEAKRLMKFRKLWYLHKEQEAMNKDKNDKKEGNSSKATEASVVEKEKEEFLEFLPSVSKEKWDAVEAKVNSANMLNVDYNSYDLDSSDDKQPDFLGFSNNVKKELKETIIQDIHEDYCLYLEANPQNERYLKFFSTFASILEKNLSIKLDNLISKRGKRSSSHLDLDKLLENNAIDKKLPKVSILDMKEDKEILISASKRIKLEEFPDVRNNNSTKLHFEDKRSNNSFSNEASMPKKASLTSHDSFDLPLSPAESDKSFNSSGISEKSKDELKPKRLSTSSRISAANNSRNQQRYSSDDLYKPRLQFSSRRRAPKNLD